MENETKRYAFQTRRGYLGYITPQKTEIGTIRGISEFKTIKKAKIYAGNVEENLIEITDDIQKFQEYLVQVNNNLPKGEEKLFMQLVVLNK